MIGMRHVSYAIDNTTTYSPSGTTLKSFTFLLCATRNTMRESYTRKCLIKTSF